ncbi:MAG: MATE family efflux transporter [Zavarzinia sp.]|nr:MATE family efflux transporter [Zavarzinia sp.]
MTAAAGWVKGQTALPTGSGRGVMAEARALIALGLPLALGQLAGVAMLTTDTIMLGRVGPGALAAAALGFSVIIVPMMFLIGLAQGAVPLMAYAVGAKRHHMREVRRIVRQTFWATGFVCLPVIALLWNIGILLRLIGQEETLAAETERYVRAVSPILLTGTWYVVLRNFMATYDRPRAALVIAMLQVPVNGIFIYALIFGHFGLPALGVVGAGLGSVASGLLALIALVVFILLDRCFRRFRLFGRFWRADGQKLLEVVRLGTPIGLTITFEVLLFSGAAQLMGLIGPLALAAHQIAIQIASVTFMFALGIGQAGAIRIGIAAGSRDADAIGRTGWTALVLGCGFMGAMALVMLVWREDLAGLFLADRTTADNAAVFTYATGFLVLGALFQVVDAAQVVAVNLLRGLQDARVPMLYAMLCYWGLGFTLSWALAFPFGLGGDGVWWGFVIAIGAFAVLMVRRFASRRRIPAYRDLIEVA